ncbi:MAG: hypothetical protein IKX74_03975, partial [Erysipelotrichaceae bacterium]|nr:hypothetical protein [Erysipelotrichaceae bacterium]
PVTEEPISFVVDDGPLAVNDIPVSVPVTPAPKTDDQLIKPITMPQMKTPKEAHDEISSYADSIVKELEQKPADSPQVTIDYNEPVELDPYAQTQQPESEVSKPLTISEEHYNGYVVYNNDSIPSLYLDEKELVTLPEQPNIPEVEPAIEEPAAEVQPLQEEQAPEVQPVQEEPVPEVQPEPVVEEPLFTVEPDNPVEQVEEVLLDEDFKPVDIEPIEEEMPVIFEEPVNNDIDYVNIEETLGQLSAIGEQQPVIEPQVATVEEPAVAVENEEETPYSFAADETEDDKFFNSINEILDNVPEIENPQPAEPEQASFALEDTDTSVDDIAMAISQMDLNNYNFSEKEEEPVAYQPETQPEPQFELQPEPVREPEYRPANEVEQPVYYDDPETVSELTEQLHTERELREEMAEQTKQLKLQMSEYENEINNANSSMTKTNKILNFVLTLLILLLFAFLLVIGYWFAQERGLI